MPEKASQDQQLREISEKHLFNELAKLGSDKVVNVRMAVGEALARHPCVIEWGELKNVVGKLKKDKMRDVRESVGAIAVEDVGDDSSGDEEQQPLNVQEKDATEVPVVEVKYEEQQELVKEDNK